MAADNDEPRVRVVDRRWWAREESADGGDESSVRKPTYVEELERQLADKNAQLGALVADHRRSSEEFEQARARIRREVGRDVKRTKRAMLAELLEVLDNLDRAIAAARGGETSQAIDPLAQGVRLVRDQFLAKLNGFGVTRISALGQPFDTALHDAVTTTPVDDPAQDGLVVSVVREGYAIGDEILRPASVVVGKTAAMPQLP